jgi:hypothetical protein
MLSRIGAIKTHRHGSALVLRRHNMISDQPRLRHPRRCKCRRRQERKDPIQFGNLVHVSATTARKKEEVEAERKEYPLHRPHQPTFLANPLTPGTSPTFNPQTINLLLPFPTSLSINLFSTAIASRQFTSFSCSSLACRA